MPILLISNIYKYIDINDRITYRAAFHGRKRGCQRCFQVPKQATSTFLRVVSASGEVRQAERRFLSSIL